MHDRRHIAVHEAAIWANIIIRLNIN